MLDNHGSWIRLSDSKIYFEMSSSTWLVLNPVATTILNGFVSYLVQMVIWTMNVRCIDFLPWPRASSLIFLVLSMEDDVT